VQIELMISVSSFLITCCNKNEVKVQILPYVWKVKKRQVQNIHPAPAPKH